MSTLGALFKYEAFNMKYQRGKGIFDSKATSVMVVEEQRSNDKLNLWSCCSGSRMDLGVQKGEG